MLISVHVTAAAASHDPRWALADDEAKQLAKAIHECNKYLPSAKLDPRFLAFGNLAYVATLIYGTRIAAMLFERAEARKAAKAAPTGIGSASPFGSAAPYQPAATAPPPSEGAPGPHPATATNPGGASTTTTYRKVAPGLVDEATLAAAMQGLGIKT